MTTTITSQKILIIAPHAFGYTEHIATALKVYETIQVHILYLDRPAFQYKGILHKAQNFFSKMLFRKNLKKAFVDDRVCNAIRELGTQDQIFVIRPDVLTDKTLKLLKKHTHKFIAYYYDSTRRFPNKIAIKEYFDKVYSYDKEDVATYGFDFLTNYVFEESTAINFDVQFYNISTHDYRYPLLERLAKYIQEKGWSGKIQVFSTDNPQSEYLEILETQKGIEEVAALIKKAKILVEIQRTEQVGLSFRIFEALGHRKKLITTNKDIVNYDFYHPQNILVVDENAIEIPDEFVTSPYCELEETILDHYRIRNWVKRVFELEAVR